ncbi:MAG: PrgI family protein [Bacillota bacterium]
MEVKVPKEVRKYHESIVFGLSMRQFICSAVAVGIAVLAYFGLRQYLGNEGVSWVCIFVALPVALIGFVTYHEMTLEHFIWAWIKSEFLMPKRLYFKANNYMYMAYQELKSEKTMIKKRGEKSC